ncbi:MAG: helicase C-terminal domain-containing protein [Anaerolineae bacterium]
MRGILVAIDLETTGLDADAQIIEIGAAKFRDGEVLETFSTLVNPGMTLPQRASDITGIKQEDLIGAPKIAEALPQLVEFVSDSPVIGHNVDFDLRYLHRHGALANNLALDTYELASILLPSAPRYNLNALTQLLNIAPEGTLHRALTDTIACGRLYWALWQKLILEIPISILREIAKLAQPHPWRGKLPIEAALAERAREISHASDIIAQAMQTPPSQVTAASLHPADGIAPVAVEGAAPVTEMFNQGGMLLLEAPATLEMPPVYLEVAAKFSLFNQERVVIAHAGESSRQRLLERDIPALQTLYPALQAVRMRRRTAYLCPARLAVLRRQGPQTVDELRMLAKALIWLSNGASARGEDLSLRGPIEYAAWEQFNAENDACTAARCETEMSGICPLHQDRLRAERAHLVLAEHAVLLEPEILPPFRHIVVDETHLLEDSLTDSAHIRLDASRIRRILLELGDSRHGLIGDILEDGDGKLPPKARENLARFCANLADAAAQAPYHLDNLFKALKAFLDASIDNRSSEYSVTARLTEQLRGKPAFGQVRAIWSILSQFTEVLANAMAQLAEKLVSHHEKFGMARDLAYRTSSMSRKLGQVHNTLSYTINGGNKDTIYWAEISHEVDRLDKVTLHAAPLTPAIGLKMLLWEKMRTSIMTGAALRVENKFDFLRDRLGLDKTATATLPYPNHDQRLTLVFLASDAPEPTEGEKYARYLERAVIELAMNLQGRIVALFSNFAQLRQSGAAIVGRLSLGQIPAFDQSDGTSPSALLESFRAVKRGVLLGVRGIWDDTEFTAHDTLGIVLTRLPFAVPNEPIFAARSEQYEDSFNQYAVPVAVLRFRQSIGRLIDARTERGVLVVLDKRMSTREYAQLFLDSLPPSQIKRTSLNDLGQVVRNWLNESN